MDAGIPKAGKTTTCGHVPSRSPRGNRGLCDRCRLLAVAAMRLRQAAEAVELDRDLTPLAVELRAIAADPAGRNAELARAERHKPEEQPGRERRLHDRLGDARATGRVLQHSASAVGSA
jgi:hypothetical protein